MFDADEMHTWHVLRNVSFLCIWIVLCILWASACSAACSFPEKRQFSGRSFLASLLPAFRANSRVLFFGAPGGGGGVTKVGIHDSSLIRERVLQRLFIFRGSVKKYIETLPAKLPWNEVSFWRAFFSWNEFFENKVQVSANIVPHPYPPNKIYLR